MEYDHATRFWADDLLIDEPLDQLAPVSLERQRIDPELLLLIQDLGRRVKSGLLSGLTKEEVALEIQPLLASAASFASRSASEETQKQSAGLRSLANNAKPLIYQMAAEYRDLTEPSSKSNSVRLEERLTTEAAHLLTNVRPTDRFTSGTRLDQIPTSDPLAEAVFKQTGYTLLQRVGGHEEANVFAAQDPNGILRAFRIDHKFNPDTDRAVENLRTKLNGDSHLALPALLSYGTLQFSDGLRTYQVFEFRDGQSMMDLGQSDFFVRLSWTMALDVARQILEGIDFLFKHGVYHGDLVYRNVMISGEGHVTFTDYLYGQESPSRFLLGARDNMESWEEMALYVLQKSLNSVEESAPLLSYCATEIRSIVNRYWQGWDSDALTEARARLQALHQYISHVLKGNPIMDGVKGINYIQPKNSIEAQSA
jgi:tRNA A-37 threonylcarbamoyl transferase component Bud32